jgi:hypothetical protein
MNAFYIAETSKAAFKITPNANPTKKLRSLRADASISKAFRAFLPEIYYPKGYN